MRARRPLAAGALAGPRVVGGGAGGAVVDSLIPDVTVLLGGPPLVTLVLGHEAEVAAAVTFPLNTCSLDR